MHALTALTMFCFITLTTGCGSGSSMGNQGNSAAGPRGYAVVPSGAVANMTFSQNPSAIPAGGRLSVTITPDAGFATSGVVSGTCSAGTWSGDVYTTGAINSACTLGFGEIAAQTLDFVAGDSTKIDLAPIFNTIGIYDDWTTFSSSAGYDANGDALSSLCVPTTLTYDLVNFRLGTPNVNNVLRNSAGLLLNLPQGQYQALQLIGSATNGAQEDQKIVLTYSTGEKQVISQHFSDWSFEQNGGNETLAAACDHRDVFDGSVDNGANYNVYAYQLELDPTRTLVSVELPGNPNIQILAMSLGASFPN